MIFRVISDLHIDLNLTTSPVISDDVFTVICGDTSGYPKKTIKWINDNVRHGVGVSGNHLPYNHDFKPIQAFREELAAAFPLSSDVTYFDAECGVVSKEVDGVLFVGSCCYSDMAIKSDVNPTGDIEQNKRISHGRMNDYRYGIYAVKGDGFIDPLTPANYIDYNRRAMEMMDSVISENEKSDHPKDVVVVTHYPLVREVLEHSYYVDRDNFPSYGNDRFDWFMKHPSIKCHCCGHCHDMDKNWRAFKLDRTGMDPLLVVNNSFGYAFEFHEATFNLNRFVDTATWDIIETPEPEEVRKAKEAKFDRLKKISSLFG